MMKKRILDIATSEFAILGYSALSMNNLAKKLEINKATIYYHFKDKKSLYNEGILSLIQLDKDEREAIANSSLEAKEKFKQYIKSLIYTMENNPNIIPLTLREMAGFDIGIESNISNDIENDIICMKKIVLELNLKDKYKNIDFYELKAMILGTIFTYYSMQKTPLKLKNIKNLDKDNEKILNYIEEFISNILLDALCEN
ncbi:MAG: TetR/AcrR family transcriptional regulator [Aliarcobacter sp.]|jgi:DNA-binding transcriptional regulator YhcF (GntR family)|nr:TetR/AcrR family transcriptional regulator [Aliarcobacter sp.]